ncbi:ABC transporter permease [Aureimonas pseudogalii]|uniref:Peptide/nickel transport system permease protein n=1 Tax=Aureimonas pseudogalii TaxID=1744844 RepID=A0A7W6ML81_9HYPH|nr:ABC transporter permease [Aureimonas pseudogalii]MBB3999540.1 peptide/nickel transport system permease protein [Aureimonas pseudogalii]
MLRFILRRVAYMVPTLFAVSIVAFVIIQLPPGDYLTTLMADWASGGGAVEMGTVEVLRERYGLDQPIWIQYFYWISGIVTRGDFGISFELNRPVTDVIWGRLGYTFLISFCTLLFIWALALPIGIYSAVRQYSIGDYVATFFGFLGLAIPNFLLALVLMYVTVSYFGTSVGGLFSPAMVDAPWSLMKFADFLAHVWLPILVVGTAGLASLIRIMRANLLDELHKPYVTTARAKGVSEFRLLLKYPVRVALNPLISTLGWILPALVSGEIIVSVVLSLPTTGPMLLRALLAQDMYLAGSIILMVSVLTLVGTLVSDILLAIADPRIRFQ